MSVESEFALVALSLDASLVSVVIMLPSCRSRLTIRLANSYNFDRLFKEYRRGPCVMCPALADVNQFEVDLMSFLTHRHLNRLSEGTNPEDQRTMNGMSLAWVALLYAVFASGVQFSITKSKKERQFLSHVYGRLR